MRFHQHERGQSMVGMLIVLVIIGLVFWWTWGGGGSDGGTNPQETVDKAREARIESEHRTLEQAINMYRSRKGQYPPSLEAVVEEGFAPKSAIRGPDGELYEYDSETGKVSG